MVAEYSPRTFSMAPRKMPRLVEVALVQAMIAEGVGLGLQHLGEALDLRAQPRILLAGDDGHAAAFARLGRSPEQRLEDVLGQVAHDMDGDAVAGEMVGLVVVFRQLVVVVQAHQPGRLARRDQPRCGPSRRRRR